MKRSIAALLVIVASAAISAQPVALRPIPPPPDVGAAPANAIKSPTGLASRVVKPGTGKEHPVATDLVTIHYTGWTTDGAMYDSSVAKGKPTSFRVNSVIPGLTEGLQLMVVGETRRLWVPESLAKKGPTGKAGSPLVLDVELLDIPTRAPADVKAPPAEATRTPSGLAYVVLKEGVGGRHPKTTGSVMVHYTGWTTDGKMFDSSVVRGEAATFPLDQVVAGWTEGLQLMVEGEKTRFWIPEKLAYKGEPGKPSGMLVFDVELIKIQ